METDTARILTFYTVSAPQVDLSKLTQKLDQFKADQVSILTKDQIETQ